MRHIGAGRVGPGYDHRAFLPVPVQAVFKIEGDDQWQWEDWTDKEWVSFCRDVRAERLEELIVVISNSEYKDRDYWVKPVDKWPTIMVSDMGCWRYEGNASVEMTSQGSGGTLRDVQSATGLVFERIDAHPDIPYPFQTLHVQAGEWFREYTLRGDCTMDGRAEKTLGGGANSLWTITGATSGPSIGRYLGFAQAEQDITVKTVCPDGTFTSTLPDWPYFDISGMLTRLGKVFHAAPGGVMKESGTYSQGGGFQWAYDWTLTPQREP